LDDPYECEICGESLPDGDRRCPNCASVEERA
jgi:rubrerythrin